jgi:excisionase family DNA binding protein
VSDVVHDRLPFPRQPHRTGAEEDRDMDALLMKVPEAAAALGVSRAKLYELIACGALPAVKVDGCRRVRTEDLVSYVNRLTPTN